PLEYLAEHRTGAALLARRLERVLHLPENLRLADDERVEPRGDAEQVRDRRAVAVLEQVRLERLRRELVILAEEPDQLLARARGVGRLDVDLRTVARRQHDRFAYRRLVREREQRRADVAAGEVQPLAQRQRRRPMA